PWDGAMQLTFPESVLVSNTVSLVGAEMFFAVSANVVVPLFQKLDFGHAPSPGYPTLLPDAARHGMTLNNLCLGSRVDAELDGQPSTQNQPDDDGVAILNPVVPGATVGVGITASKEGRLDAWVDLNRTAGWELSDKIFD